MKKIILIILVMVLVFGVSFYLAKKFAETGNVVPTSNNQITNEVKKNEISGTDNKKTNEAVNNTIEEIKQEENKEETNTETFEESPKTEIEKAIDIVKKDWNGSSNISFIENGIDNNGYIINVCDSETMDVLAFYIVNVKNNTIVKKEIN